MLKPWRKARPQRELPGGLEDRLQRIPEQLFLCRDTDRLWAPFLGGELDAATVRRYRGHLEGCERCRELTAIFESAGQEVEPRAGFMEKLRGIPGKIPARRTRPSAGWLLDLRLAVPTCYALAMVAVALCGKPAACLDHAASWAQPVVTAVERMEELLPARTVSRGAELWNEAVETLRSGSLSIPSLENLEKTPED